MSTAATPSAAAAADAPVPVPLGEVEREIARQMKVLQGDDEAPVQTVRMSNLVVFCDRKEQAQDVAAQVPDIVAVHPARVMLLLGESSAAEDDVKASVLVRAHRLGAHRQACSELIMLQASGAAVVRLPFAVRALQIGDLPTNLWWSSTQPPVQAGTLFYELAEYAQQIIYDSLGWLEPARAVSETAAWLDRIEQGSTWSPWRVASDLNWRRLKYWRRLAGQALDPASAPGAAESMTEVRVEHGPHAVVQAWEFVAWLAHRHGWIVQTGKVQPGVEIAWDFKVPPPAGAGGKPGDLRVHVRRLEQGPPEIRLVRIVTRLAGAPVTLSLAAEGENRLAIRLEGVEAEARTMAVPQRTGAELVGRQLSDRERDPVFRASMVLAQMFAKSTLR